MKKFCCICKIEKELTTDNFGILKRSQDGFAYRCKECKRNYDNAYFKCMSKERKNQKSSVQNARNQVIKNTIREYKASKGCFFCSEKEVCCLDCHHKGDKKYNISDMIAGNFSINNIMKELEKCVIICSNCHRKLHAGIIKDEIFN